MLRPFNSSSLFYCSLSDKNGQWQWNTCTCLIIQKNLHQTDDVLPLDFQNVHKQALSQCVSSMGAVGVKIHCKKITDTVTFKCQAGDLYRALTEKDVSSMLHSA